MKEAEKLVADMAATQIHPLCGQTVKMANVTEHISLEESKKISLFDVVTRPGFLRVILRLSEKDFEPMVLIQSVEQI